MHVYTPKSGYLVFIILKKSCSWVFTCFSETALTIIFKDFHLIPLIVQSNCTFFCINWLIGKEQTNIEEPDFDVCLNVGERKNMCIRIYLGMSKYVMSFVYVNKCECMNTTAFTSSWITMMLHYSKQNDSM